MNGTEKSDHAGSKRSPVVGEKRHIDAPKRARRRLFAALLALLFAFGCTDLSQTAGGYRIGYEEPQLLLPVATIGFGGAPTAPPAPTPAPTSFTIAWMSDTQEYSYNRPAVFDAMCEWIAANRESRNILAVLHTGDVTDNGASAAQWENALAALALLPEDLPLLAVAGNHDVGATKQNYALFTAHTPVTKLPEQALLNGGEGVWTLLEAGGEELLLIGLGWGRETALIGRVKELAGTYPNAKILLFTHSYLNGDGSYSGVGKRIFENLVRALPSVRLVLCGHDRGEALQTERIDDDGDGRDDRLLIEMMYNAQRRPEWRGRIRLLTFDPARKRLTVTTFSPYLASSGQGQTDCLILPWD